jgi:hypothetical protein
LRDKKDLESKMVKNRKILTQTAKDFKTKQERI